MSELKLKPSRRLANSITHMINNQFYLPASVVDEYLENYYILHWQGNYIISQISSNVGYKEAITHKGYRYMTRFIEPLSNWKLLLNPDAQYKLSFRRKYNHDTGIVLIKQGCDHE